MRHCFRLHELTLIGVFSGDDTEDLPHVPGIRTMLSILQLSHLPKGGPNFALVKACGVRIRPVSVKTLTISIKKVKWVIM